MHSYTNSNCTEIETGGWYSPFVLNQAAVKKISVGTAQYGMSETCTEFDVSQVSQYVCMYVCMYVCIYVYVCIYQYKCVYV